MMSRCSTSPTPSETPLSTPVVTPSPMACAECTCFGLISTQPFTIEVINCYNNQYEIVAEEGFPGQWVIYVCAYSYTLVSGAIDDEFISSCFYGEGWECPA